PPQARSPEVLHSRRRATKQEEPSDSNRKCHRVIDISDAPIAVLFACLPSLSLRGGRKQPTSRPLVGLSPP
ncbi:hypothetical protein GN956_G26521, partial [Arapaima gigas]